MLRFHPNTHATSAGVQGEVVAGRNQLPIRARLAQSMFVVYGSWRFVPKNVKVTKEVGRDHTGATDTAC